MTRRHVDPSEVAPLGGGNRGAIIRLFGVILIILGTLDIMLSWRGAFDIMSFHVFLLAAGLFLCLIGAIRRQYRA
jgi:hypothetical protein